MALTVRKPDEKEFQLPPEGTHIARCYAVIDLGLQDTTFGAKHKIRVGWELPDEKMEDGRPFVTGKDYTASLHPDSGLTQDLTAWRGRSFTEEELAGFDVFKVLGAYCMVTIIHTVSKAGKKYANVKSVIALPKGTPKPEGHNEIVSFSLESPDEAMFQKLPEWLQKKVNRTVRKEAPDEPNESAGNRDSDYSDIPF